MSSKALQEEFPLHWLVWDNQYQELDRQLARDVVSFFRKDLFSAFTFFITADTVIALISFI